MTAADRGPIADVLHLAGVVVLMGGALSLAAAVIWYTIKLPAAEPPRLADAPGLSQLALDPQAPAPKITLPEVPPGAPVIAALAPAAEPQPEVAAGLAPATSAAPAAPAAAAAAAAPAAQANAASALPPGFFQPATVAVHEVFGTAADTRAPYLALRSRPAREANQLGKLDDGTQLKVVNRFGKWQLVQVLSGELKGTEGFVYAKYVRPFGSDFR